MANVDRERVPDNRDLTFKRSFELETGDSEKFFVARFESARRLVDDES